MRRGGADGDDVLERSVLSEKSWGRIKNKPNVVSDAAYFNGLLERISKTEHIGTFREFIDFVINESSHMQRHLI